MRNRKKIFSHAAVYMLFFVNTVYAMNHGFHWLHWVATAFVVILVGFDIRRLVRNGR